jgi:glycosyltransferase involved in cell wall biosynthesis
MKIIVAHAERQHSFKTAEALYRNGMLFKYITIVYDKPYSWTWLLKFFLKGNIGKRAASRRLDTLPDSMIKQFYERKGLLLLLLSRISAFRHKIPQYYHSIHDSFGKKVAEYAIKNNVDAVIVYDGQALKCFELLKEKAPGIKRIMDVSIASMIFLKEVFEKDALNFSKNCILQELNWAINADALRRVKTEIELTDYFMVASNMVKNSLLYSGVSKNQISIVPYGVDIEKFNYIPKNEISKPLNLLFVGQINYRKGIHHLLKVVSEFPIEEVELFLVGGYDISQPL